VLVDHFSVGPLGCNCVILGDEARGEAVIVDPGGDEERILERLAASQLRCAAIIHTHTHFDHVGATAALQKATGAPVMIHERDLPLYLGVQMQIDTVGLPLIAAKPGEIDRFLHDDDVVAAGSIEASVLHTPGHTPGSLSFYVEGERPLLLAGDTLFQQGIGRTDLWGGSYDAILQSIRGRLLPLPEETLVIAGHGPSTTIGDERRSNPFLR
jgi:glyoxylase-like metal-dependent hydrolase (beta-lactamase superfamily II)